MRFVELNFVAWGPFTEQRLDLSKGEHGLHVVFGPNEAGKSSALRGLRALLFGIPGQTTDNFVHAHQDLRIAGRLCAKDDRELSFARRKGNKNTLLDADRKNALGDDALRPFLGAITAELFATHFGLDHDDLVRGGNEILAGHGDVGRSLFSAAVGGPQLREVIEGLDREAAALFSGRAHNPKVNQALRELGERHRAVRDAVLSVDEWRRQQDALDAAIADRDAVGKRLAAARSEVERLTRLRDLLPKLDEWRAQRQRRDALGEVVLLPFDFGEQRTKAFSKRDRAQDDHTKAEQEIADRERELAALVVEHPLLEAAEEIDALHEALGSHRKADKDSAGILQRKLAAERDAQRLLADIDPKLELVTFDRLRPSLALRARIETLAKEALKHESELKTALERLKEAEETLSKVEQERATLPPACDASALTAAVEAALAEGKGADLAKLRRDAEATEATAQREIDRLGLWRGPLDAAERLSLPGEETIARIEAGFAEIDRTRTALASERVRHDTEAAEAERQLAELVHAGDVPAEADFEARRTLREQLWKLVRRAWLAAEDVAEAAHQLTPQGPLPDAYEASVTATDAVSDRLRREADRVAVRAGAQARLEQALRQRKQIAADEAQLAAKEVAQQSEWHSAWTPGGINPRSPKEMRAFVAAALRLRELAEKLREARGQIAEREQHIESLRAALLAALRGLGETKPPDAFLPLLTHARRVEATITEIEHKRVRLAKETDDAQRHSAVARRTLDQMTGTHASWEQSLREATNSLPLRADATAEEAVAVLRQMHDIVQKLDDAKREEVRLNAIHKDAQRFQENVAALAARVAADLDGRGAEEIAKRLHERRGEAATQAVRRDQTDQRRQEAIRRRDSAARDLSAGNEKIQSLCEQARCGEPEQLAQAEECANTARQIDGRIAQIEGDLATLGATVAQAELEAATVNREQLAASIETLGQTIRDNEQQDRELSERIGEARNALGKMNGEAHAARASEEEQVTLARIREGAERYVELCLAARLLRHEIERYRAAHQDPLLVRASEIFVRLTLGSFARLEADFDERDEPVLVGVRPTGGRVRVEGMSAGTRDQLHLALRLAHVVDQIRAAEPLPLVLDDLLVHFDDARSAAALSVLAEMSDRTQVLLFTHHERVRDLAREVGGKRAFVHDLRPVEAKP